MRKSLSRTLFLGGMLGFILGVIVDFSVSMNQIAGSANVVLLIISFLMNMIGAILASQHASYITGRTMQIDGELIQSLF